MALSSPKFDDAIFDDGIFDTTGDTALVYAIGGVARGSATRGGYVSPKLFVAVGGLQRTFAATTASHKIDDFSIIETAGAAPNKAQGTAIGWEPTVGMEVIATMGSINRLHRRYAGTVLSVDETNYGSPDNRRVMFRAVDWTWALNRTKVLGYYTGTADAIAVQLMTTFAPAGYTSTQIESGFDTIEGGITFTNEDLSVALDRLAKRASKGGVKGATHYIDYRKDLYFRVTDLPEITNPQTLTRARATLKDFSISRDLSQVFTRVSMEGGGSTAATEVAIGATTIPVLEAPSTWYGDVAGVVLSGPQAIPYTARVAGGGGSLVGPGASPSTAAALALAAGAGVTTGSHDVTVVYVSAAGRSLPSPVNSISVGAVAAPTAAPVAGAPTSGGSVTAGAHYYAYTEVTPAGETTAGPISNTVTALAEVSAPSAPVLFTGGTNRPTGKLDSGAVYGYQYTYWDGAARETTPSAAATVTLTNNNGSDAAGAVEISSLGTPPAGFQRRWYRTEGGGATYKLMPYGQAQGQFAEISGGYYIDVKGDAELGTAAPSANTTKRGTVPLTGIGLPSAAWVTDRKVYGTAAGESQLKFIASIGLTATTYSVTLADAGLGANAPASAPTANQISVSAISIGGTGTTARELYMSPAGGGARKRALAIADNATQTGTITMSDATLAGELAEPTTDTSGLTQPSGQVLSGSTTINVAGLAPFAATGGWAFTGTQYIRYTSFNGSSLAGIPASGVGSIRQSISYNSSIAASPMLTGVTGVLYTIPKGQDVNIFETSNDTEAQATLAALLNDGTTGVKAITLRDRRLSRTEATARARAFLNVRSYHQPTATYRSKDTNISRGRPQVINIHTPTNVTGTYKIQTVTITNFTAAIQPDHIVQASTEFFSVEDLFAREP